MPEFALDEGGEPLTLFAKIDRLPIQVDIRHIQ